MIKKINEYLEYQRIVNGNKGTGNYESIITDYLIMFYQVNDKLLDPKDLVLFYKQNTNLGNNTINKCIKLLRVIHKHHKIENEELFSFRLLKEKYVPRSVIPIADLKKIFKYVNNIQDKGNAANYRMITYVLWDTGVRPNELLNIKTANVDIKNNCIYLATTKTGKPRYVFMSAAVTKKLKEFLINHNHEYLFYNHLRDRQFTRDDLKNFWRRVKKNTGIESLYTYKFRHTYITDLIDLDVPLVVAQQQAGHQNIKTTMIYYHASTKNQKKHIDSVERDIY